VFSARSGCSCPARKNWACTADAGVSLGFTRPTPQQPANAPGEWP
jgi:hypothetical protein